MQTPHLDIPLQAQNTAIRNREANMGDFFTDAVREMHKVNVALVNGGTMRGDKEYVAGELTKKTLVEMPLSAMPWSRFTPLVWRSSSTSTA